MTSQTNTAIAFNSRTIKFIGHIETISPVTVSLPKSEGYMPKNTHGSTLIPAGSIRGLLRHAAHFAVTQLLAEKGEFLSVDDHLMLANGIDSARVQDLKGNGIEKVGANSEVRTMNPVISLFGNFVLESRLKVGNAFSDPTEKVLQHVGKGSRSTTFYTTPEILNFIPVEEMAYLDDVLSADRKTSEELAGVRAEAKKLEAQNKTATKDEKDENYARIAEIKQMESEVKENRTGSVNTIRMILPSVEAIDQGVRLSHRMTLKNPSEDEIAFFFWALTKASTDFNVGGRRNIGCGDIKGFWRIMSSSFKHPQPREIGRLTIDDDGFKLETLDFDYQAFEEKILSGGFDFTKYA